MVCTSEDDYTSELQSDRAQALWQAELSDGTVVTMDDGRPGASPPQAWLRLAAHCEQRGLSILRLWLKFRSNVARDILPAGAEGYFFCQSAIRFLTGGGQLGFFLVGALMGGKLVVQRWQVPELVLVEVQERDPNDAGPCLIRSRNAEGATGRDVPPPEPGVQGLGRP